ncbi:MAG: pyridoxamine 5'-phosphate oxidase family protein [Alphaproteobacteria bacterium]|nr:pyridoxamine 5'-phosphate oxidase family protein [Alphaproteobacteria bacterium]
MAHIFAELAFTDAVRQVQEEQGSRRAYTRMDGGDQDYNHLISENEAAFIESRDSFYMATISETGWPYIQHRGGAPGFVKALNERQLGFLDYRGNRQYITVGNLRGSDRVSLFFMDYARKGRLKILGRAKVIETEEATALGLSIQEGYRARAERAVVIDIAGFDWNCPQHITERFTLEELRPSIEAMQARIAELEAQLAKEPA